MSLVPGLISVIMSNFNTPEEYLREAIESVLNQTYSDFEFIIIDDCSTNNSLSVIESYCDSRIKLIKNIENMGLTKSINVGMNIAQGEYIARMDADDVCFPTRFEEQVDFLLHHQDVIVCGSKAEIFGEGASKYKYKFLGREIPEREVYQIHLLFGNHINIPNNVAMFRHKALQDNGIKYNDKYIYAQDFRMWVECSKYGECHNLSAVLVKYRIHNAAVSVDKKEIQKECAKNIMAEQLSWLDLTLPDDWETIHWGFLDGRKPYNIQYRNWIEKIISQNRKNKVYNQEKLENILWCKWAETSYFALAKERNPFNMMKILINIPLKYWGELVKIRKSRTKKD